MVKATRFGDWYEFVRHGIDEGKIGGVEYEVIDFLSDF